MFGTGSISNGEHKAWAPDLDPRNFIITQLQLPTFPTEEKALSQTIASIKNAINGSLKEEKDDFFRLQEVIANPTQYLDGIQKLEATITLGEIMIHIHHHLDETLIKTAEAAAIKNLNALGWDSASMLSMVMCDNFIDTFESCVSNAKIVKTPSPEPLDVPLHIQHFLFANPFILLLVHEKILTLEEINTRSVNFWIKIFNIRILALHNKRTYIINGEVDNTFKIALDIPIVANRYQFDAKHLINALAKGLLDQISEKISREVDLISFDCPKIYTDISTHLKRIHHEVKLSAEGFAQPVPPNQALHLLELVRIAERNLKELGCKKYTVRLYNKSQSVNLTEARDFCVFLCQLVEVCPVELRRLSSEVLGKRKSMGGLVRASEN